MKLSLKSEFHTSTVFSHKLLMTAENIKDLTIQKCVGVCREVLIEDAVIHDMF